ncbi:hypothetical protein EVAR_51512_1 [Eumeta japonica]|uniref:Uncharacterized protein n=1 Tax=Eumeta variegata TaxID=151549 RepID=A0A4C1XF65_EUMVA|nr:hypothetical protein EVAR_51512_1 [Eumeta japonica]
MECGPDKSIRAVGVAPAPRPAAAPAAGAPDTSGGEMSSPLDLHTLNMNEKIGQVRIGNTKWEFFLLDDALTARKCK